MAESASARDASKDELTLKIDLFLANCRIWSDINQSLKQGEMSKKGPFSIDRNVVPVEFYQRSLLAGDLDAVRVLSDITRLSGWREPVYRAVDYRILEGFQSSVEVRGKEMASEWRGWSPKLAQNFAAATFLKFLGFAINVDSSVFPGWSSISDQDKLLGYVFGETRTAPRAKTPPKPRLEMEKRTNQSPERSLMRMERFFRRLTKTPVSTSNPPNVVGDELSKEIKSLNQAAVENSCNKPSVSSSNPDIDNPNKIVNVPLRLSVWDRLAEPRDEKSISNSRPKTASSIRAIEKPKENEDNENSSRSGLRLEEGKRSHVSEKSRDERTISNSIFNTPSSIRAIDKPKESEVKENLLRSDQKLEERKCSHVSEKSRDERPISNSILNTVSSVRAIDNPKENQVEENSLISMRKLEERKRSRDGDGHKFSKKLKLGSLHPHGAIKINEMDVTVRKEPNVGRGVNRKYSNVASTSESECETKSKNTPYRKKVISKVSMVKSYCRFNEEDRNIKKTRISPSCAKFPPSKCSKNIRRIRDVPSSESESDSSSEHICEPRYYMSTGFYVKADYNTEKRSLTGLNRPLATCSKDKNNDIQVHSKTKYTYFDSRENESESNSTSGIRSTPVKPRSWITPTKDCFNKLSGENQPIPDLIDRFIDSSTNSNKGKQESEVRTLEEISKSHEGDIDKAIQITANNHRPNEFVSSPNCQLASGSKNAPIRQIESKVKKEFNDFIVGESESPPDDQSTLIPSLIILSQINNRTTELCASKAAEESQSLVESNTNSSSKSDKNTCENEVRTVLSIDDSTLKYEGNLEKHSKTLKISSIKCYIEAYKKEARKHIINIGEQFRELSQTSGTR